jgi:hypothetical protein
LITKPKQMSALDDIHGDPEKYAGYYLRSIDGNLQMNGDVSAEQNHSGVVAYLGEGACFAVAEQITHLLSRQKNIDRIRRQREDDQFVRGLRFQSPYFGPAQQADDAEAKKTFSGYGFTNLWTWTIKKSWKLQSETLADNSCLVWPTNETKQERSEESSTIVQEGCRCSCPRRIAFMIQCEHEYVIDGGIDIFKFDSRWFHRQSYDKLFPDMATVFPLTSGIQRRSPPLAVPFAGNLNNETSVTDNIDNDNVAQYPDDDGDTECSGDSETHVDTGLVGDQIDMDDVVEASNKENFIAQVVQVGEKVTYSQVMEKCSELARTCQNDQSKMRTLIANLHCMKERVRDGHDIFAHYDASVLNMTDETGEVNINQPRNAISRSVPNATKVHRFMSGNEYHSNTREFNSRTRKRHRQNVSLSQVSNSNDDVFLPAPNVKSRSCTICRMKGHGQGRCPYITKFGTTPLEKNNEAVRQRLQKNLSILTTYELQRRQVGDTRTILTELPSLKEIKGLVIHKRFLGNGSLYNPYTPENICLECTVLHLHGVEHPSFTNQLFNVDCISAYIIRNKINIIMCQLQESSGSQYPNQYSQPHFDEHAPIQPVPPFTQLTQESNTLLLGALDCQDSHI